MSIIRETLNLNNSDLNLKINLGVGNRILGYQQEIDYLTEETKIDLINSVIDNEVRRFNYDSTNQAFNLMFYFSASGSSYYNSFMTLGGRFNASELNDENTKIQNSFFILEFYDTYDNNTQTKIFTNYLTQILNGEEDSNIPIPKYRIYNDTVNQFYNWYIPQSYIDEQTGSTTVTGYIKFSFYNAKYGDITVFYNKDNDGLSTPEKMYFKIKLDLVNMTWKFDFSGINYPPNAVAYQIPFTSAYSQRINDGVESFDNEQQVYPTGNTFQTTDGTYISE